MTTLVFTASTTLGSRIIRWFTGSAASHVALGLELGGVPILLHADLGGVQVSHRAKWFRAGRVLVAEFRLTTGKLDVHAAATALGERYDYVGLLGFVPVLIGRWFGRKLRNPFASAHATVCSEFVMGADPSGAIGAWAGLDPERTSPADLLKLCQHSGLFAPAQAP